MGVGGWLDKFRSYVPVALPSSSGAQSLDLQEQLVGVPIRPPTELPAVLGLRPAHRRPGPDPLGSFYFRTVYLNGKLAGGLSRSGPPNQALVTPRLAG